ncbi:response regulator [Maricaulis parjimensis]|uniref:response regulator n=1 Tax=Maricaulis parjimensis TaxID=144023 RepID=UPI001939FF2B|nr:response regulator [Maricaulis parjimensis]
MRIAIVDDDAVEHMILSELGRAEDPSLEFQGFEALDRFIAAGPGQFDHVFLDRCLPPYDSFEDTLKEIAAAGYGGHVILMTADAPRLDTTGFDFQVTGPINKIDLLNPGKLAGCLARAA